MSLKVKRNGVWKTALSILRKSNGVWVKSRVLKVLVKINGVWTDTLKSSFLRVVSLGDAQTVMSKDLGGYYTGGSVQRGGYDGTHVLRFSENGTFLNMRFFRTGNDVSNEVGNANAAGLANYLRSLPAGSLYALFSSGTGMRYLIGNTQTGLIDELRNLVTDGNAQTFLTTNNNINACYVLIGKTRPTGGSPTVYLEEYVCRLQNDQSTWTIDRRAAIDIEMAVSNGRFTITKKTIGGQIRPV